MERFFQRLRQLRRDQLFVLLLFGVLLLVIALPSGKTPGPQEEQEAQEGPAAAAAAGRTADESTVLAGRLQELLAQVEGVGEARVMITLRSDGKKVVEKDRSQSQDQEEGGADVQGPASVSAQSSESTVYQRDGKGNEIPYVSEQESPEIAGVLVVAQGGGNPVTVREITEAVMALFGVEAHKIKVMKME